MTKQFFIGKKVKDEWGGKIYDGEIIVKARRNNSWLVKFNDGFIKCYWESELAKTPYNRHLSNHALSCTCKKCKNKFKLIKNKRSQLKKKKCTSKLTKQPRKKSQK